MATYYKKGRTTPLLYLCKSKVSPPGSVAQIKKLLEEFNVQVVEWKGGLEYDQESEEKIIKDCDYMLLIGPRIAAGQNLLVGKGQMLQANAFTRANRYPNLLIIDEVGDKHLYVSEAARIELHDPNNYVDSYARIDTNKMFVNLSSVLNLKSKFLEKVLERGEPALVKVERRSSDSSMLYGEAPRVGDKLILYNFGYPSAWCGRLAECIKPGVAAIPGTTLGQIALIENFQGIEINPLPEEGGLRYGQLIMITGMPFIKEWHGKFALYLGGKRFGINTLSQTSGNYFQGTSLYKSDKNDTGYSVYLGPIKTEAKIDQLADIRRPKLLVYAKRKR